MNNTRLNYGKVSLRPLEPEDLNHLYLWENDPEIWQVSNTQVPFSRYILKQYIAESHRDIYESKQLRLIIENEEGKVVGAIDLFDFDPYHQRAGIGILIYADADRRQGYSSDALELIKGYSKNTLGLHQLYANIAGNNLSSIALFEKCGFQLVGTKKDWLRQANRYLSEHLYQCLL